MLFKGEIGFDNEHDEVYRRLFFLVSGFLRT